MKKKRDRLRIREIQVERLVVREPRDGRTRAIIETAPPQPGMEKPDLPTVRLTLMDGHGRPAILAEVDAEGQAALYVGGPDSGPMVVVTPMAVDVWHAGNLVAAIRSDAGGGVVETLKPVEQARRSRRR